MKRTAIFLSVVALACLIAIGGGIAYSLFDSAEKSAFATEAWASRILKSDVSVERTEVALGSGGILIEGVRISNPPGFSEASAIEIQSIRVEGPLKRDGSGTLVVPRIVMEDATVTLETSAGAINLERLFKASSTQVKSDAPLNGSDLGDIEVGEILLLNSTFSTRPGSAAEEPQSTTLPDSRRRDVGANQPVSSTELATHAMRLILIAGERATRRLQPTASTELLAEAVKNLEAARE